MPKEQAESIAMKYLERVKIPDQAEKYPGQLSLLPTKGSHRSLAVYESASYAF